MMDKTWWRKVLTIADLGLYGSDEILKLDPGELAEVKSELGFNAEHLSCTDVYGGEKGIFYFKSDLAKEVPRDFLGEYIPEARKRGIRVLIYDNVHWLEVNFAMEHPDWLQVGADGSIIDDLYGSGCAPCVNSSWRDWSFQVIRDLAAYDIDGIFLDGPIFAPGACHCPSCQRLFKERYGAELPQKENWEDPTWRDFIEFRFDSIASYLKDAERTLKDVRPEAVIYMNSTGLSPAWPAARDNRRLMPHQDILGAEGGFLYYDLRKTPLWKPGMTAKLLETQAGGKPTVIFIAGANKGWDEYLLPPTEIKLLYADTVANGANPWYGISLRLSGGEGSRAAREMNRFLLDNAPYFESASSFARVALLWSSHTADHYRASVPVTDFTPQGEKLERRQAAGNFYGSFVGCYEALLRSHIPFDVLDDAALTANRLNRYDLLVAPNCACLSRREARNISEYVRHGGNLLASFETSRYDEKGVLLEEPTLKEVFGVEVGKGTFGPMKLDYISIVGDGFVSKGLSARLLPSPIFGLEVIRSTARALAMYHEKMRARYVQLPPISKNPAILTNEFGEGQSVYLSGNFFEHYNDYHSPDSRRMIENSVRAMSRSLVTLANCPRSVEVSLRYQREEARLMVHLVNFTGEMTRPMESVVPLRDIQLTLHGSGEAKRAFSLRSKRNLTIRQAEDGVSLNVPLLREYDVIVVEPF